jgi:quercetin dioxygenase-like cupin family protein
MFGCNSSEGYHDIRDGIKIKTISYGKKMLMSEFLLKKDSILPNHSHPYEQTGYLIKGNIKLFINGISKNLKPGDSWNIPENIDHKAEILEDSVVIDIFSPARDDYLNYINQKDIII